MLNQDTAVYAASFFAAILIAVGTPMMLSPNIAIPVMIFCALALAACVVVYFGGLSKTKTNGTALWGDVRIADSADIKRIMNASGRKKLIGLLQSGGLAAWAYRRDRVDMVPLEPRLWSLYELEFANVDGKTQTLFRHPSESRRMRPWKKVEPKPELTQIYDVHLNSAQLHLHWPELFK